MSSKIDKVIKAAKMHDERLQELELAKISEEEVMNKLADISDIVGSNLSDIIAMKEQISFLYQLVESIGDKLDVGNEEEDSKRSPLYS